MCSVLPNTYLTLYKICGNNNHLIVNVYQTKMEETKKLELKRKRFASRIKSSKGIICTVNPGRNIVLCNAGQATGLDKETILKIVGNWCQPGVALPKFIAEKGESHSFLVFITTEDAKLFFNTCNGIVRIEQLGSPLYMSFVENVPNTEVVCEYPHPNGLTLLNDFITIDEESTFMTLFGFPEDIDSSNLKNRQVKHYGYEFRYISNDVDLTSPLVEKIPEECDVLWERLKAQGIDVGVPDQLTVNKYTPGQGIPSHVDRHSPFGDTILSLSLGSSVVMDWKHHTGKYVPVELKARSMLIMRDEARYDWQHGIQPRTRDPVIKQRATSSGYPQVQVITDDTVARRTRISLTFRWTRAGPCQCSYKTLCDSVGREDDIDNDLASNLEELHVHQVYERIAGHFSRTRHKPWPRVVEFMRLVPTGAVLLDLGCGNGKNILMRNDILQIGGERSSGLLAECAEHVSGVGGADCVRLDLLHAGLRDACADVVICIAVIHHFSSQARRLQAIMTITRLLRVGGTALITVWAKDQTKSNYLCKNKTTTNQEIISVGGINLPVHENRTQFQHNDLLVPWKLKGKPEKELPNHPETTFLRYYHVFEEGELENLFKDIQNVTIENSFYEEGNWCVICKKI